MPVRIAAMPVSGALGRQRLPGRTVGAPSWRPCPRGRRRAAPVADLEVGGTTVAVAAGAVGNVEVGGRAVARAGSRAVEVLPPQQELDGVVADRDIGLDLLGLLERVLKERRGDGRSHPPPGRPMVGFGDWR
jgi:hypothetical protein